MEHNKTAQRPEKNCPGQWRSMPGTGPGNGLPAAALAVRLADLKRQLALRQAMA